MYVCLLLSDEGLRVWGEGSEQNLRHVLLAKGHQEQRQALIGRIHAATLQTEKRGGCRCVSATKTTQKYVMEVEKFKKDSATPGQGIDYLRSNTDSHLRLQNIVRIKERCF